MMKKISILFCLLVASLTVSAKSPYNTKAKVINRAKAIVAYHVIATRDGKIPDDVEKKIRPKDVDELKKYIMNPSPKYDKICNDIKSLEDKAEDKEDLIKLFEGHLQFYSIQQPTYDHALDAIKKVINGSDYPFNEKEKDEDEDDDDKGLRTASAKSSLSSKGGVSPDSTNLENSQTEKNSKHEKPEGFSLTVIIIVILVVSLLASLYLYYQLLIKKNALENEKSNTITELSKIVSGYGKDSTARLAKEVYVKYIALERDKNLLIKEKEELRATVDKTEKKYGAFYNQSSSNKGGFNDNELKSYETKGEESPSPTVTWNIQRENQENPTREQEVVVEKVVSLIGKEMFLYLPNDGMFKEGSEEYRSGKTLYKMVYTSEETADFEFINKPETLAFAKQSRSRFLEGACFIENDDAISFSTILTLEKGKLVKADEGWNIISKAHIRLS